MERFYVGNALLDRVFQQYERKTILNAGPYKIGEVDIELTVPYIALANKTQTDFSYDLKDDKLVITKKSPNLYGKTFDELEIVNLTKIRLAKEKQESEQKLLVIIAMSLAGILVLCGVCYVYVFRRKPNRRTLPKSFDKRGRHGK